MSADVPLIAGPGAVLLLGMHRSGTSALAHALGESGLWLGDDAGLLEAHPSDNPTGYWERRDVHDLHVRCLDSSGYDWNQLADFDASALPEAIARTTGERLGALIGELDRHRPWLVKDPRLSLLLPLWLPLVPDAIPVVAVRHPLEIAGSLRQTPRGTYSVPFLLLLWQKYLTRMIADLADRPAIYVAYSSLLDDPVGQLQRAVGLLKASGVAGVEVPPPERIQGLFRSDLRRQRATDERFLTDEQRDLFDWLLHASRQEEAVAAPAGRWSQPDDELREFEASAAFFVDRGRALVEAELVPRLATAEERTQVAEALARSTEQRLQRSIASLEARLKIEAVTRASIQANLVAIRNELDASQVHIGNIEKLLAIKSAHIDGLEDAMAQMRRSFSWRLSAPVRWLVDAVHLRPPAGAERWLHRLYYRLPGLTPSRKRAIIEWLHRRTPWLTRHTLSYSLYQLARQSTPEASGDWLTPYDAFARKKALAGLSRQPLVSILMPVYNTDPAFLQAAIESVQAQSYRQWQLCIADDASTRKETKALLAAIDDPRIMVVRSEKNGGIAAASNAALAAAEGELVALLDHDDLLAPDALLASVEAVVGEGADFVYTDEDKIDFEGRHVHAHFKADYSPDYLMSINYLCHFSTMRRDLLERIGGFREGFDGAQDFDLFLRYLEHAEKVVHIPKVLYHWRMHEASTAAASEAKPKSWEAGRLAVADALSRRAIDAVAELGPYPNTYRVQRRIVDRPLVSIIVPFKDQPDLLSGCVDSILAKGGYDNFELLAVDNRSVEPETAALLARLRKRDTRIRTLAYDAPFNYSAINNWAVTQSRGDVLLFLNNDIEAISQGWLASMLAHAQRPDVGTVGALLLYDDDTVQHGGVIVGLGGVAGHSHLHHPGDSPGYFSRLQLVQELSAVTFACAMTRRDVFDAVGGLNEADLTIAFNDIDYCLRVREQGLKVIYTPEAKLYHYESKSRGYEDTPEKQQRFAKEIAYMQSRHAAALKAGDPFYNPNFALDRPSFTFSR